MKKYIVLGSAVAALLLFSSCLKDNGGDTSTAMAQIQAYNLYTPMSGTGSPFTALVYYNFETTLPAQTISFWAEDVTMPGGTKDSFKSVPLLFSQGLVMVDGIGHPTISFSGSDVSASGSKISALNGLITNAAYAPGEQEIPDYKRLIPNSLQYVLMQYVLNDSWQVRTFWPDMTFRGSTKTSFPAESGETSSFENDKISYRVVMGLTSDKKYDLTGKADVIFYNAQFAPGMPGITVVLKNLDLKFTNAGYTISGKNAVPFMVEAGQLQETPRFKFNEFSLDCTGDLTSAIINYRVADVFQGSFEGQNVAKSSK